MEKANYDNTYWSKRGKHENLSNALAKLVPQSGEVQNADRNPALEKFRVASNCYYDMYNNGFGNRDDDFRRIFGFDGPEMQADNDGELTQELVDRTEAAMDDIVMVATLEQVLAGNMRADYIIGSHHQKALEAISNLWPEPPNCANIAPEWVGPNDGRMRADLLKAALEIARKALGKTCGV